MKKMNTVSELDILYAAWLHYLELFAMECDNLERNPSDLIALHWKGEYQKIVDELHDEIIRLENNRKS